MVEGKLEGGDGEIKKEVLRHYLTSRVRFRMAPEEEPDAKLIWCYGSNKRNSDGVATEIGLKHEVLLDRR